MNTATKLFNLGIFIDNDYFNKYCDLITNNRSRKRELYVTQKHHIIPKFYYTYKKEPIDNTSENLVHLKYKDHILAHYYLERCLSIPELKGKNFFAIYKLCGSANITRDELYLILEDEGLLEEFIHYKTSANMFSEDHRRKLSEVDKKMIYVHKDGIQTKILPELLSQYLADGWTRGGKPGRLSAEHKAKLAASHKNISDKFRQEQSIRIKDFYKNNPDYKTKSKHAVEITNPSTGESTRYQSCKAAGEALGLPEYYAKGGHFKRWIDIGYINIPRSKYHNWKIVFTDNE